jgi:PAS domain S-box-containing protein
MFSFGIATSESFKRQIIRAFVVGFFFLIIAFVAYMVKTESDYSYRESNNVTTGLAQSLAVSSLSWVLANDVAGLQEVVYSFRNYPELRYAMIISPKGRVLAHSDTTKAGQFVADEPSLALLKAAPGKRVMIDSESIVDIAVPIEIDKRHVGWARIGLGRESIADNLRSIILSNALFVLLATALSLLAATLIAKRLGSRIDALVKVAEEVRTGNFATRAPSIPGSEDEITKLADSLNQMLDALARNEERLRAASLYTRSLIEASLDPLVTISAEGKITDVNKATEEATGKSRSELIGTDFSDYFTEPDRARNGYRQVFLNGFVTDYPLALRHRNGHISDVLYNASIYHNEAGEVLGVFAAARDVTERKLAEEAIRVSEARFSTIFNQAPLGIALIDSLTGKIHEVNPRFAEIAGRTVEEMATIDWMSITHPDDVQEDLDNMTLLNAGKISGFNMDKRYIRPDGSFVWINMTIAPLKMGPNTSPRHLCMIDDITERKLLEKQLQRSEHGLKEAQRIAHLGSWDLNLVRNVLSWSDEIYRIFEIDPEKFGASYDAFLNAIHPDDRALVNNTYTDSVKNGVPYNIEHRLLMKDGRIKYVKEIGETYYDEDGKPLHSFGIVHDITERKQTEAVLALHIRDLGERIKESECLRDITSLLLNKEMGMEQVLDACVRRMPAAWLDPSHTCARIRLGKQTYESANFRETESKLAAVIPMPSMESGLVEIFYFGEATGNEGSPFLDEELTLMESIATQIAQSLEKRLAEAALQQNQAELKEAQRIAHVGSWRLDRTANHAVWSEELYRIFGLDPELPPPGYPEHHMLFTPGSWKRLSAALLRTQKTGVPYELELEIIRADEKHGWVLARGEALQNPDNIITGLHGIAMDITERKQAEENIRRLNSELEQRVVERTAELESFSYSVSHDLRTPLRAIDGFSNLVLERYEDKLDDEGKRLLNVVRDNTKKMGQLIDDILAFSRAGRLEIKKSEVDIEALAREVWQDIEPLIAGREVRLNIKQLPKVQGDPAMLRQVWANLLGNAAKFTHLQTAARIEVGASVSGNECTFYVKDNGTGFDPQYMDKLFGVFQRLHGVDEFEGTGIGLAIVKRIVTRHGGRVWAEGKLNEGATFYFALPRQ